MVLTNDVQLPEEHTLDHPEIPLSSPALKAASFHLGKYCENQSNEFLLCRTELDDPRKCLEEGKALTNCAFEFLRKLKKTCKGEFEQYTHCLDQSSQDQNFRFCRKTQAVYDQCVLDKLGMERPEYGYFCRVKVHNSSRPPPPQKPMAVYPDATEHLPEDYPKPPAKYGSRFHWLH
uniref:NADH dehydrogenase [ubiquinone] 1 alpha subcomplex subunit 8 n=1 Tax=Culicoides sonorensis TaxID=179676 RepID=A0A336LNF5_CULSO